MPLNICMTCIGDLIKAYLFTTKCQQTHAVLQAIKASAKNLDTEEELCIEITDHEQEERAISISDEQEAHKEQEEELVEKTVKIEKAKTRRRRRVLRRSNRQDLEQEEDVPRHNGRRVQTCPICSRPVYSYKLTQHLRSHTKEKPYECNICLQKFSIKGNLKRHMMTHTGERPHVCDECGKGIKISACWVNSFQVYKYCFLIIFFFQILVPVHYTECLFY